MKNTILIFIVVILSACAAQAQRGEVRKAERELNRGGLEAAGTHIETAIQDPATGAEAKTWLLRAQIYMQITMSEDPVIKDLVENPLDIADESAAKAESIGLSNLEIIQFQQMRMVMSELMYNEGVEAYNDDRFTNASSWFLRSYNLNNEFGVADTTTLYNAGLAAEIGQDFKEAKRIYTELLGMNFDQPYLYSSLSNIYLSEGDTITALGNLLQGRQQYPDDMNLIFSEANIYIFTGNVEKAKDILALAIEKDPGNPGLYFALAANFDKMSQDTAYSETDRKNFFQESEKYYKSSIDLDEDYFDAIFNLGVLYFNEGIRLYNLADESLRKTQNFRQYEQDEKKFKEAWLRSQPFFEKAKSQIIEDDAYYETVVISLIQLYARTDQPEKLKEVEEIYHRLFAREEDDE